MNDCKMCCNIDPARAIKKKYNYLILFLIEANPTNIDQFVVAIAIVWEEFILLFLANPG